MTCSAHCRLNILLPDKDRKGWRYVFALRVLKAVFNVDGTWLLPGCDHMTCLSPHSCVKKGLLTHMLCYQAVLQWDVVMNSAGCVLPPMMPSFMKEITNTDAPASESCISRCGSSLSVVNR